MKLGDLISDIEYEIFGDLELDVADVCIDTRKAKQGDLFVCIRGENFDSHQQGKELSKLGVKVIVCEHLIDSWDGCSVVVKNSQKALASISQKFFSNPSADMIIIGITGTNGKTTLTYMIEHLMRINGLCPAVIGTINMRFQGDIEETKLTTPMSLEIQRQLAKWRDAGAKVVIMEVSSIAIHRFRVDAIDFDMGIFTNLTRDHLGYHGDMENYFLAKQRFFNLLESSGKPRKIAVINTKSSWGQRMFDEISIEKYRVGENVEFSKPVFSPAGLEFCLKGDRVSIPMTGEYNLENVVTALTLLLNWNQSYKACFDGFLGVPGRLEIVDLKRGRYAYVDYAHTPDALENSASSLKLLAKNGPLWTVFGCGGDRDRGKRPMMAAAAETYSDRIFVTSDNPRYEDPQQIASDILQGFSEKCDTVIVELDRQTAIARAVAELPDGGLLLVAGKGHEDYQETNGSRIKMDDREILRAAVDEKL